MALNYTLLRYQCDNIPLYDGNPKLLQRFVTSCENLLRAFQNRQNLDDPINICLFDTILGKLTGRAADLVASRSELSSWQLVKEVLIATFADQRSIDCLIQDLITLKPFKGESLLNFGMRIQDTRSLLFAKLSATQEPENVKLIKIEHYDGFALKTFINSLPYNMQLVVRLKEPESLERAMSYVREEENFIYFKNQSNVNGNFNNTHKPHNNTQQSHTQSRPHSHTHNNNYRPNFTPSFTPTHNNFPRFPYFPNQTVAYGQFQNNQRPPWNPQQPNFRSPQIPPKPVFGQPHQFRPNIPQNINRNPTHSTFSRLRKPEPMDTSSGNTVLRNAPRPKFASQELYNQETTSGLVEGNTQTNNEYIHPNEMEEASNYSYENQNPYEYSDQYQEFEDFRTTEDPVYFDEAYYQHDHRPNSFESNQNSQNANFPLATFTNNPT